MRIIKRGKKISGDPLYRTTCRQCESAIEFAQSEARFVADQRDGDALVIKCPACKAEIWTAK